MEELSSKGLYVDDLQKLRVMDPELASQTEGLKNECGDFVTQMADFQKMADGFIALSDEVLQIDSVRFLPQIIFNILY